MLSQDLRRAERLGSRPLPLRGGFLLDFDAHLRDALPEASGERCRLHSLSPTFAGASGALVPFLLRSDSMADMLDRITINPNQCGGRPCIRGMRIRVTDVLDLLAEGQSQDEILGAYPYLEPDDIAACLRYAVRRLDHPTLAA
jgi:uncharacterized protein (DUF433 family)